MTSVVTLVSKSESERCGIFAAAYVAKGFHLQETCRILKIDMDEAILTLKSAETAAHLDRITKTGDLAAALPTARIVLELLGGIAEMDIKTFAADCVAAGIDPSKQSIPAFLKAKLVAITEFRKTAMPSLMAMFKEYVNSVRAGRRRLDENAMTEIKKQFNAEIISILDAADRSNEGELPGA